MTFELTCKIIQVVFGAILVLFGLGCIYGSYELYKIDENWVALGVLLVGADLLSTVLGKPLLGPSKSVRDRYGFSRD